jgi:hypothetical protein
MFHLATCKTKYSIPNYISRFLLLIILTGLEQTTNIAIGAGSGVTLILLVVLVVICLRFVKISCTFYA